MCVERGFEVGQVQAELHVEGASGLLQAVVVVELLVGEVGTLQADAVASVVHRVAHRGIVCELGRDILLARRPSQTGKAQVVLVDVVARVVDGERVAARQDVAEAVARVAIDEEVGDVRHPLPVRDVLRRALFDVAVGGARRLLAVGDVLVRQAAAHVEAVVVVVAGGRLDAMSDCLADVLVGGRRVARQADALEDEVLGVAVDVVHLRGDAVPRLKAFVQSHADVEILRVLRLQVRVALLDKAVAEHLDGFRHAVCLFEAHLCLEEGEEEVGRRRPVAELPLAFRHLLPVLGLQELVAQLVRRGVEGITIA